MDYTDKVVIVTGAGQGIGKAIAQGYANKGAKLVIAEKNLALGKDLEEEINKSQGQAIFIKTDVSKEEDIINLIKKTFNTYGSVDILINNVGVSSWKSPYEISVEEWDYIINTNLRSVFICSREFAKQVKKKDGGSIVNIASTRAFMSEANSEAYAASKGGIIALTHALAASFAKDHIIVNSISPGWIETEDYDKLSESDHQQHFSARVGKTEDIARACMFLTDEKNNFINGENLIIDGGMTKKMIYE